MFGQHRRRFNIYRDFVFNDSVPHIKRERRKVSDTSIVDSSLEISGNHGTLLGIVDDLFSLNNVAATVRNVSPTKNNNLHTLESANNNNRSKQKSILIPRDQNSIKDITNVSHGLLSNIKSTLQGTSISSIHLSEFEQPPQSTSTPQENFGFSKTLSSSNLKTSQFDYNGSFPVRPKNYSSPVFKFEPVDHIDDDLSMIDTNISILSPKILDSENEFAESPLSRKLKFKPNLDTKREDISSIVDQLKINTASSNESGADVEMNDQTIGSRDYYLQESDSSKKSSISTSQDIRRNKIKRVKISENVVLIPELQRHRRKRPLDFDDSNDHAGVKSNKKVKKIIKNANIPDREYFELLRLCGDEKDPLHLITKTNRKSSMRPKF
ncbi:hypothetical protein WICMUC_005706 [Wickerhamomyces mucosus]|uniref:Uncharacterized protein n=1 Tax=Wickerhamomyces mucosus TaxID=1378264 RepID=A0A9P8T4Y6_9ASCO|nr:hypothetical protein WICMUC_005706 [Wickerhamomyces mucosus]